MDDRQVVSKMTGERICLQGRTALTQKKGSATSLSGPSGLISFYAKLRKEVANLDDEKEDHLVRMFLPNFHCATIFPIKWGSARDLRILREA